MLTRLEVDGFKSFRAFGVDLAPLTVILGPNATGKSNLFDAIRLLGSLAAGTVADAVQGARGQPSELFSIGADGEPGDTIRFAAEVLLPREVDDPTSDAPVELKDNRLRYELELRWRRQGGGPARMEVWSERVVRIRRGEDPWVEAHCSGAFIRSAVRYSRKNSVEYLHTVDGPVGPVFLIKQDGGAGRDRPDGRMMQKGHGLLQTVLSTVSTPTEFPHLFALRQELRGWLELQLEPSRMRAASPTFAAEILSADGANLATVLNRLKYSGPDGGSPEVEGDAPMLGAIAAGLAGIVSGLAGVDVREDKATHSFRIWVRMADGKEYPASLVSDGTLRMLAIFTVLLDPERPPVLCLEEPENGIHPERLARFIVGLCSHVTDPRDTDLDGWPLRQLLVNSHSPVVLSALIEGKRGLALFFDMTTAADGAGGVLRRTRVRPVVSGLLDGEGTRVTNLDAERYLSTVRAVGA